MATSSLPAPGTQYGPCVETCTHRDCVCSREMASALCTLCTLPIGWETRFFGGGAESPLYHAACAAREDG